MSSIRIIWMQYIYTYTFVSNTYLYCRLAATTGCYVIPCMRCEYRMCSWFIQVYWTSLRANAHTAHEAHNSAVLLNLVYSIRWSVHTPNIQVHFRPMIKQTQPIDACHAHMKQNNIVGADQPLSVAFSIFAKKFTQNIHHSHPIEIDCGRHFCIHVFFFVCVSWRFSFVVVRVNTKQWIAIRGHHHIVIYFIRLCARLVWRQAVNTWIQRRRKRKKCTQSK